MIRPSPWRPIATAPTDGSIVLVWCPSAHGLPAMYALCAYHPDAGFCVDELRVPMWWLPLDTLPPLPEVAP